jgi:tRNA pseudouridine65 synthase
MDSENTEQILPKRFTILAQDTSFVAIDKPSGFHVHQPEFPNKKVSRDIVCLGLLRNQVGQYVYPVHRIDVATSGILLFALSSESASKFCKAFSENRSQKTYYAVVRGFLREEKGRIEIPLESDSTDKLCDAITDYEVISKVELPFAIGKRHPTARYSLVKVKPVTGRFHQIRRHFGRLSHPIVGDNEHGDSHHNRFFRERLGVQGLMLRASALEIDEPSIQINLNSVWPDNWKKMFEATGLSLTNTSC